MNAAQAYEQMVWVGPPLTLTERISAVVVLGILAALIIYALRKL